MPIFKSLASLVWAEEKADNSTRPMGLHACSLYKISKFPVEKFWILGKNFPDPEAADLTQVRFSI